MVGAGLAGLAVAWRLSRRGIRPLVLDALADPGDGCFSGCCDGIVEVATPMLYSRAVGLLGPGRARAILEMSRENAHLIREFAGTRDVGFRACGAYHLTTDRAEFEELIASWRSLPRHAGGQPAWEPLQGPSELERTHTTGFMGGVFRPEDAAVDPLGFIDALTQGITECGASVHRGVAVEAIDDGRGGRLALRIARGVIEAEMVILAAGAGSPRLNEWLGECLTPVLGQAVAWTGLGRMGDEAQVPVSANFDHVRFRALPAAVGRSTDLVAGVTPWSLKGSDPQGREHRLRPELLERLERYVGDHYEPLRARGQERPAHRWAAHAAHSIDNLPVVGTLPGRPRLICCGGFSGHDWGLAFVAARDLAAAIDGARLSAVLETFSPRRFIAG
ncbi:MAG: NAD(P)/FAD-dependent oxidoreductase [Acidobacteriota bacterium]